MHKPIGFGKIDVKSPSVYNQVSIEERGNSVSLIDLFASGYGLLNV